MAQAFFNLLADPAKARSVSAGTQPGPRIHPAVLVAMREKGLDLGDARPQALTPELTADAQWLITMGCGEHCPVIPGLHRADWSLPDPAGQSVERVRQIRDDIEARVRYLLESERWLRISD
jgi:arsenate reductase